MLGDVTPFIAMLYECRHGLPLDVKCRPVLKDAKESGNLHFSCPRSPVRWQYSYGSAICDKAEGTYECGTSNKEWRDGAGERKKTQRSPDSHINPSFNHSLR